MKLIYLTVTLALAISATQAAPEKKIVIPVKRNPNYVPNTQSQIAKIHTKYRRDIPPNIGEMPLTNFDHDTAYLGTVYIGTPPKPFAIDFDTGSSDFWVGTPACRECAGQRVYDPKGSSSYSPGNQPWSISYGDHSNASGIVVSDTVNIGGIQIKNLPIYAANQTSKMGHGRDGLLGLGFSVAATVPGVKTPFEVMVEKKLVSSPIFSIHLGKTIDKTEGDGEYVFGGSNSAHIGGDLTRVPVDSSEGYWGITMNNIRIGNTTFLNKPSKAIIDTGTSLIGFPKKLALEIAKSYNAIDHNGTFTINCNENELSPLVINIEGTEFTIPPDALIFEKTPEYCIAGFSSFDTDFTILGDSFMKNYYFIFNTAVPQIQIAPLK